MSAADEIVVEKLDGHIAVVTIDRSGFQNSITEDHFHAIVRGCERLDADDDVRVIVLRGTGRWFCTGADVRSVDIVGGPGGAAMVDPARDAYVPLHGLSTPLIGCINGAVAGGGIALALACDMRIVAESAIFATSFSRLGATAHDSIAWFLPRVVGLPNAFDLLYRSRPVGSGEAARLGLANRVVSDEALWEATMELAADIAGLAPVALRLSKRLMVEGLSQQLPDYLRYQELAAMINRTVAGADLKEGIAAFVEKRRPNFGGAHLSTRYDTDFPEAQA